MKRRTLLGSAAMTLGGASVLGTGAFTSVKAERSISVDVAGDASAFLKLEPCSDAGGTVSVDSDDDGDDTNDINPNFHSSDAVVNQNGMVRIDLTKHNGKLAGNGVTEDAVWRFPSALKITNQGTQRVCVDLRVGSASDGGGWGVPSVEGEVDDDLDFGQGDPAIIIYNGSGEETSGSEIDTADTRLSLEQGASECVGFDVRTFGLDDTDFSNMTLRIKADAESGCAESGEGATESDGVLSIENAETYGKPNAGNGSANSRVKFELSAVEEVTISKLEISNPQNSSSKNSNAIAEISCDDTDCPTVESGGDGSVSDQPNYTGTFDVDTQVELDEKIEVPSDDEESATIGIGEFKKAAGNSGNQTNKSMNNESMTIKFHYDSGETETIYLTDIGNNAASD